MLYLLIYHFWWLSFPYVDSDFYLTLLSCLRDYLQDSFAVQVFLWCTLPAFPCLKMYYFWLCFWKIFSLGKKLWVHCFFFFFPHSNDAIPPPSSLCYFFLCQEIQCYLYFYFLECHLSFIQYLPASFFPILLILSNWIIIFPGEVLFMVFSLLFFWLRFIELIG